MDGLCMIGDHPPIQPVYTPPSTVAHRALHFKSTFFQFYTTLIFLTTIHYSDTNSKMIRRYGLTGADNGAVWNLWDEKGKKAARSQSGGQPRDRRAKSVSTPPDEGIVGGRMTLTGGGVHRRGLDARSHSVSHTSSKAFSDPEQTYLDKEPEVSAPPPPPQDVPLYEGICYLHAVASEDSLQMIILKYDTTIGIITDVNQLEVSVADDLQCLPPSSLLVVPASQDSDVVQACMKLNTKPEFIEQYGSRLPGTFLHRRASTSRLKKVDDFDRFNECDDDDDTFAEHDVPAYTNTARTAPPAAAAPAEHYHREQKLPAGKRRTGGKLTGKLKGMFNAFQSAGSSTPAYGRSKGD